MGGALLVAGGSALLLRSGAPSFHRAAGASAGAAGLVLLAIPMTVLGRTETTVRMGSEEERPLDTYQRACDPEPLARMVVVLRRGPERVPVATDGAGQFRMGLRQLRGGPLAAGTWEAETSAGRPLGRVTIPAFEVAEVPCGAGQKIRVKVGPVRSQGVGPQGAWFGQSLEAELRALEASACHTVVDADANADEILVGHVLGRGDVVDVQLELVAPTTLVGRAGRGISVSVPEGPGLMREVGLRVEALLATGVK